MADGDRVRKARAVVSGAINEFGSAFKRGMQDKDFAAARIRLSALKERTIRGLAESVSQAEAELFAALRPEALNFPADLVSVSREFTYRQFLVD
jgi:hypothetical protein